MGAETWHHRADKVTGGVKRVATGGVSQENWEIVGRSR